MVELIICEKPSAAKKIAEALADGKPIKNLIGKVPYYEVTHGENDIIVGCAVGHLYGLKQKEKKVTLPIFDIEWVPTSEINKASEFSKKYLTVLKKIAKKADSFTVATDYDIEGEIIGLNVIRFICKQKDARRMKFSTLTKDELIDAYEHAHPTLEWGQANAGETRHILDWYYGINVSRALTKAVHTTGSFKLLSTGRVQGPALKLIVNKEKEIKAFKPDPYWMISLNGKVNKGDIEAWYEKDKIFEKKDADAIFDKVKDEKQAKIKDTETKQFKQSPPNPFDLTSLQIEAYRCLKVTPKRTLELAQDLYTGGYISYPRTSSQQLPKSIGYKKILNGLSKSVNYKENVSFLLKKKTLTPNDGKKTDPAHPAIYPTGIIPKLEEDKMRLYDLIARRFLATFGEPATRQTIKASIDVKGEIFIVKGTTTVDPGWHILYGKYATFKEEELPDMKKGDDVDIKKIEKHDKETTPPKRYTESSIIKELEKHNLGTKSTRASIIDTLFQRGYIDGRAIEATELGIRTSDTLSKHCHTLVDEKLTRNFEVEMEQIREGKKKKEDVVEESKKVVTEIIDEFKKDEKAIGEELLAANRETINVMTYIGKCPKCKDGSLTIRKGKYGKFVSCDKYPDCKTIYSLPSAMVKPTKSICEHCGLPKILIIKKRKKPQEVCIDSKCHGKLKDYTEKQVNDMEDIEKGKTEKICPKCKEGKLVVRKSIYGCFYGCNRFPKCRYIESLDGSPKFGRKAAK
ncbi:MAG: DNA topoisomerase I [Nanoarchaeota archaeon]|nr:DNA topoisomerase I [Nanoarchaeota archaeon]